MLAPKVWFAGQRNETAIISPAGDCGAKPKARYSSRRSGYPMTTHQTEERTMLSSQRNNALRGVLLGGDNM